MCGIAGILFTERRSPGEVQSVVSNMCRAQLYRGPDGAGIWADQNVGLGNVRLAVTGGVSGGSQPIRDTHGGINVFNGEIYNASSLASTLEGTWWVPGYSDGRVLAGLLSQGVVEALSLARGPFAIARFTPATGKLLLVRDAVGKKPLYLKKIKGGWVFASTIKALKAATGPLRQREQAILEYLIYRSVGGYGSAFEDVTQIPAGSWVELALDGTVRKGRWWSIPENCLSTYANKDDVRTLLSEAILMRHEIDRPTAIFLSGGLDSSIVAATLADSRPHSNLTAFSIGYDVSGFEDETDFAARMAHHVNLKYKQIVLSAEDVPDLLDDAARLTEDPIQDPVVLPTIKLARTVADWTKVVLTGDGSDEVWGGYARFDDIPETLDDYLLRCSIFTPAELGLNKAPGSYLDGIDSSPKYQLTLDRILRLEVSNRMRNYHLARIDKVCMGVGLEPRSPFLDLNVVATGLSIPASLKRKDNTPKGLLIDAFASLLPRWMIERKKQPFTVPIANWISGALYDFSHDLLQPNSSFVRSFLDPDELLKKLERGQPTNDALAHRIWSLIQIECWKKGFAREMETTL